MVPALPDPALAPSYASLPSLAPELNFLWRRLCQEVHKVHPLENVSGYMAGTGILEGNAA